MRLHPTSRLETTEGPINFHDWVGDSWAVLFSHPRDFTPVCTTELGYLAKIKPEFDRRNVKVLGLSVDPVENHEKWATKHMVNYQGIVWVTDFGLAKTAESDGLTETGEDLRHRPIHGSRTV